jgi:hypothetical protein
MPFTHKGDFDSGGAGCLGTLDEYVLQLFVAAPEQD